LLVRITTWLLLAAGLSLGADTPRPLSDAIPDVYTPVPVDQQRLAGLLANRLRANIEGYLEHIDEKALLEGRGNGTAGAAGIFLQAAANSYEYSDDRQLKGVMDRVANTIIAAKNRPASGGDRNRSWTQNEILTQAEELSGLIAYSRVTGSDDALAAAGGRAELMLIAASNANTERSPDFSVLLRPMADLYRYTSDERYLQFCNRLAQRKAVVNEDAASTLSYAAALVDLYALTGTDSYLKSGAAKWQEEFGKGVVTNGGQFPFPHSLKNGIDACVTAAWMQLTLELFRVTGKAQYAEELERTVYNQLIAAQEGKTGKIDACIPLNGSKHAELAATRCVVAVALGLSEIPAATWGRYGDGLAVLSYSAGRATIRLRRRATIQIYLEGTYPERGNILLHVEPSHDVRFPLKLRVPAWTSAFRAEVGGFRLLGKPGEFLTIAREWKKGDTVKISIDMTAGVIKRPDDVAELAIRRGPQILALASSVNPDLKDLAGAALHANSVASLKSVEGDARLAVNSMSDQTYYVDGEYSGTARRLVFMPFADAMQYRVWLKQAEPAK
jgi:uncharacterized protein